MSETYAGSALKQCAGVMADWDNWRPWQGQCLWLLMGGAMDPPKSVEVSERRPRNATDAVKTGAFLNGMKLDLRNMEQALIKAELSIHESISQLRMKKKNAEDHLKEFFEICRNNRKYPVVYYTGHGETGTGNWCFADGTISIKEIEAMVPGIWMTKWYPMLISDTCYSGRWANYCLQNPGKMHCLAAAPEFSTAWDTKDGGGELTEWMTGGSRPRTEPMWSAGSINDFPVTTGYDHVQYTEFISSHIYNTDKILISQSTFNNTFSGIFSTDNLHERGSTEITLWNMFGSSTATAWGRRSTFENFMTYLKDNVWKANKRIYSLAVDDNFGFGAFAISGFGNNQVILSASSPNSAKIEKEINDYWNKDYKITAVGAKDSTFYLVMTRETEEFKGKGQKYFLRSTWGEVVASINEGYKVSPRNIVTAICYSTGLKEYLVVMTKSTAGQVFKNQDDSDLYTWQAENFDKFYRPTIVFKANDPAFTKPIHMMFMTVMPNLTGYIYRHNRQLHKDVR